MTQELSIFLDFLTFQQEPLTVHIKASAVMKLHVSLHWPCSACIDVGSAMKERFTELLAPSAAINLFKAALVTAVPAGGSCKGCDINVRGGHWQCLCQRTWFCT